MTNTSRLLLLDVPVYAIQRPSEEKWQPNSLPGPAVSRCAVPPARGTSQRSPANSKQMSVALTAGCRKSSGADVLDEGCAPDGALSALRRAADIAATRAREGIVSMRASVRGVTRMYAAHHGANRSPRSGNPRGVQSRSPWRSLAVHAHLDRIVRRR